MDEDNEEQTVVVVPTTSSVCIHVKAQVIIYVRGRHVQTRCLNTDCLKMLFSSSSDAAGQNDDVVSGKSLFCQHLNVPKCCDLNLE